MTDFLGNGQTVTGDYYLSLVIKFRSELVRKRRGKLSDGVLLLYNNILAHRTHGPPTA